MKHARNCWERARLIYLEQHTPQREEVAAIERLLRQVAPDDIPLDDGRFATLPGSFDDRLEEPPSSRSDEEMPSG